MEVKRTMKMWYYQQCALKCWKVWTGGARLWRVIVAWDVCCDTNDWAVLCCFFQNGWNRSERAGHGYQVLSVSIYRKESLSVHSNTDMK